MVEEVFGILDNLQTHFFLSSRAVFRRSQIYALVRGAESSAAEDSFDKILPSYNVARLKNEIFGPGLSFKFFKAGNDPIKFQDSLSWL